jgi:hypothetical protein
MTSDLTVDTEGLRACAARLADTAAEVHAGLDRCPPFVPAAVGWATTGALEAMVTAAARRLATIGAAVDDTARQLASTATAYEAADHHAATRLRSIR